MKCNFIAATGVAALFSLQSFAAAPVSEASEASISQQNGVVATVNQSLEERVARIERMLQARNQAQLEMQAQLDELNDMLADMVGNHEAHQRELQQIVERQRELYLEIDRRFSQLASNTAPMVNPAQTNGAALVQGGASENQRYDDAVSLVLEQRDYQAAIPAFKQFLLDYPQSTYVPNAHYWLGQLHFTLGQRELAFEQFTVVSQQYPESSKAAESLLKLGTIEKFNQNTVQARSYFERVVQNYPNSSVAKLAQGELNKLQ